MNRFVKLWAKKRLKNKHIVGCIILIALVVAPIVCALVLSDSMIKAMSDKYIYLSSGHLSVTTSEKINVNDYKEIKYSDEICSGYAMMYSQTTNTTLFVKGVTDDYFNKDRLKHISFEESVSDFSSNLNGITISSYTASLLGLELGDKVAMMIVPDTAGKTMRPVLVYVDKIYTTGYEAIDSNLAFVNYNYANTLFTGESAFSNELILYDDSNIDSLRTKILSDYPVTSWMSSNYAVFSNFITSKQVIFIILMVVLVMAGFYTASAARLANEDCIDDIAIFKMVGANNKYIFKSSLITMMTATILGIIFGLILGLIISINFSPVLKILSNTKIEAFKYYLFDFSPIINWKSIVACILVLLFISFVSVSFVLRRTKKIAPIQLFTNN